MRTVFSTHIGMATLLVLSAGSIALAGPPFITDDPEPVEYQHWEVYLFSLYNDTAGDRFLQGPGVEVNYGVVPDVQLHLIVSGAYDKPSGEDSHFGLGDTELGVKYRFIHETESLPQVATFPLIEVPTGDEDRGLGNGRAQFFLPLWLQKSFGEEHHEWTTYGGGGYFINPGDDNRNFFRVGIALQHDLGEHLTLGGEIFHETSAAHGEPGHTAFNLGGFVNFDDHNHLLFSAGRDIDGPGRFFCYLGYQFTF